MQTQRKTAREIKRPPRRRAERTLTPEQTALLTAIFGAPLLTPEATAWRLGITTNTLNVWRCTGRYKDLLEPTYVGAKPMYSVESIRKFEAAGHGRRAKKAS